MENTGNKFIVGEALFTLGIDASSLYTQLSAEEQKVLGHVKKMAEELARATRVGQKANFKNLGITPTQEHFALLQRLQNFYQGLGKAGVSALDAIANSALKGNDAVEKLTASVNKQKQALENAARKSIESQNRAIFRGAGKAQEDKWLTMGRELEAQRLRDVKYERKAAPFLKQMAQENAKYEQDFNKLVKQERDQYVSWWKTALRERDTLEKEARQKRAQDNAAHREHAKDYVNWWKTALNERDAHDKDLEKGRKLAVKQHEQDERDREKRLNEMRTAYARQQAATATAEMRRIQQGYSFGVGMKQAGYDVRNVGTAMTMGVTLPIVAGAGYTMKLAGDYEVAQRSLTRLMGGAKAAESYMQQLRKVIMQTPMDFDEAVEGARRLEVLKVSGRGSIETFRILGDAITSVGGGHEAMMRVVKALNDIKTAGRLQGQEVRQLINANIDVWGILSEQMNKTPAQLRKMMKEGALDATTVIDNLLDGMNKKFGGEMRLRMQTFNGMVNAMKKELQFALIDLGMNNMEVAKSMVSSFKDVLGIVITLIQKFSELPEGVRKFTIYSAGAAAALGPVLNGVGNLGIITGSLIQIYYWLEKIGKLPAAARLLGLVGTGVGIAGMTVGAAFMGGMDGAKRAKDLEEQWQTRKDRAANGRKSIDTWEQGQGWEVSKYLPYKAVGGKLKLTAVNGAGEPEPDENAPKFDNYQVMGVRNYRDELANGFRAFNGLLKDQNVTVLSLSEAWTKYKGILSSSVEAGLMSGEQFDADVAKYEKALAARGVQFPTYRQFTMPGGQKAKDWIKEYREGFTPAHRRAYGMDEGGLLPQWIVGMQSMSDLAPTINEWDDNGYLNKAKLQFGDIGKIIDAMGDEATRAQREIDELFSAAGVRNSKAEYERMLGVMKRVNELRAAGDIEAIDRDRVEMAMLKAKAEFQGKLNKQDEERLKQLEKQVNVVNRLHKAWSSMKSQISTILTDFSRSAVDLFLPKLDFSNKGGLSGDVKSALESGYKGLSSMGYSDPKKALDDVIAAIKSADTIIKANEIAVRHFGDMGPEIARGLRDGTIKADELKTALGEATEVLHEHEAEQEKVWNKIKQLGWEAMRSIARAAIEEAGAALWELAHKHLKAVAGGLDDLLLKIPGVKQGLGAIAGAIGGLFGGGGGGTGEIVWAGAGPAVSAGVGAVDWGAITGIGGTAASTAAKAGTSAAKVGGQAAGMGLSATMGIVTGAASAISGIIGNFQMAGMNKSLDLIEHEARYSQIHLLNILEKLNEYIPGIKDIHGYLYDKFNPAFAAHMTTVEDIRNKMGAGVGGGVTVNETWHLTINDSDLSTDVEARAALKTLRRVAKRGGVA